ncbi:MAG: GtrA family protein [Pseudomonadota bacterium]
MLSKNERIQIIKFGIVGFGNTLTDILIYAFLVSCGLSFVLSNLAAFIIANVQSYVVNASFTFSDNGKPAQMSLGNYAKYLFGHSASLLVGTLIIAALISWLGPITAKLVATLVGFVLNYLVSTNLIFARKNTVGSKGPLSHEKSSPPSHPPNKHGSNYDR